MSDTEGGVPVRRVAGAKLNLALHVRHRAPQGWHHLESLFVHCVDGDVVTAAPSDTLSLSLTGPEAPGLGADEDNLVLRAARALREQAGVTAGAAITLDKRLPVASGIGGGSADAAATLLALSDLWKLAPDEGRLHAIAATLGADVAPCLTDVPKRVEGRGDAFVGVAATNFQALPVLLVNPRVPLPTAAVFALWDGADRGPLGTVRTLDDLHATRNDLTHAARQVVPAIDAVLAWLSERDGALFVRMSGSGATCFALFGCRDDRDRAAHALADERPCWWGLATALA